MKIFFIVSLMSLALTAQTLSSESANTDAGQELYQRCTGCHGTYGEKKALGKSTVINTLSKELLVTALKGYQDGTYGAEMKALMKGQVIRYSSVEIDQIAEHVVSLAKADPQKQRKQETQAVIFKTTAHVDSKAPSRNIEHDSRIPEIRIKAKRGADNIVHVKTLLHHEMLTAEAAKKIGIKQEFLIRIRALEKGQVVFDLKTSEYVSKNPLLKFKYKSLGAGDLSIEAIDNSGTRSSSSVTVKDGSVINPVADTAKTGKNKRSYRTELAPVKETFGDIRLIDTDKIQLVAPEVASNGNAVPVSIRSSIKAKFVVLYAKEEQAKMKFIGQWRMHAQSIIDYELRIKLDSSSNWNSDERNLKVVLEGEDGKFYTTEKKVIVALGGVEG